MNKPTIIVVEDDAPVLNLIATTLKTHDYKYISASTGKSAIMETASHAPDIMLLDLGLPDMDGTEVISTVRAWSRMPIIIISARTDDTEKIDALDAGADDYITKPFSVDELLARIRATQRRLNYIQSDRSQSPIFVNGNLKIDYSAGIVYINDEEIHITPLEYKILSLLAQNLGKVLTHKYITMKIWGAATDSEISSLRVFMATLRKKIQTNTGTPYIQTHIGVGYKMNKVE
ncbi:MAG: response regulator transcription factor [Faecalicoccus sp.]|nr:response regulator transcription factor [Faecalicoccus sp.]